MERAALEQQLQETRKRIGEGERRIIGQWKIIEELERGAPASAPGGSSSTIVSGSKSAAVSSRGLIEAPITRAAGAASVGFGSHATGAADATLMIVAHFDTDLRGKLYTRTKVPWN